MIEYIKSIIFGIVEGITEWLPVSSTGHLILLNEFLKLDVTEAFYEMYQVVIQLGAILAVIVLFFHKLNPFSPKKDQKQKTRTWILWAKVVVAVIPSAVIGLRFGHEYSCPKSGNPFLRRKYLRRHSLHNLHGFICIGVQGTSPLPGHGAAPHISSPVPLLLRHSDRHDIIEENVFVFGDVFADGLIQNRSRTGIQSSGYLDHRLGIHFFNFDRHCIHLLLRFF